MVFQCVATEELELLNSAIQPSPCQGVPAYEGAEADALATSPKPGLLGNTLHKNTQITTKAKDVLRPTNTTNQQHEKESKSSVKNLIFHSNILKAG